MSSVSRLAPSSTAADPGGAAPSAPATPTTIDSKAAQRLRTLVDAHLDLATRMVRNVGAPEELVEDIVQQAFQICATRIADIDVGKERAFLIQTALRLVTYTRRVRAQSREVATEDLSEVADDGLSPEELSDRRRAVSKVGQILAAMDLDQRAVFLLYEVEELTMAEIATLLGVPPGTVASRLRRARADFLARASGTGGAVKAPGGSQ